MNIFFKRLIVSCLAIYIVLGPGLVQVFGVDFNLIKTWRMYSGVGLGAPYGQFIITTNNAVEKKITLLDAMGIDHIRKIQYYPGSGSLQPDFNSRDAILMAAQPICAMLEPNQILSFEGRLAYRGQWQPLNFSHQQLCDAAS